MVCKNRLHANFSDLDRVTSSVSTTKEMQKNSAYQLSDYTKIEIYNHMVTRRFVKNSGRNNVAKK